MSLLGHSFFKEFRNRVLSRATAVAVKALYTTVRFDVAGWQRVKLEGWHGGGVIFALWHNGLMVPLGHESCKGVHALMSAGQDGEFATRVVHHFGVNAVRGSTSKNGVAAVLRVIRRAGRGTTFAVTPDGPRGPRYGLQPGTVYLASRTGLPVAPLGIALSRAWKLRSWDRYRIPKPFCRAYLVFGKPVHLPRDLDKEQLEDARRSVEQELHRVSQEAAKKAGCAWPD